MKKAENNEQPGIPMLGYVFTDVAHVGRFMQPATEHVVLFDHFLGDSFWLIFCGGGGAIVESVIQKMSLASLQLYRKLLSLNLSPK